MNHENCIRSQTIERNTIDMTIVNYACKGEAENRGGLTVIF